MAWIKIEHSTPSKPEISQLAGLLGMNYREVMGALVDFWIWADQQSTDGYALGVTRAFVNHVVSCDGFAEALTEVGWLAGEDGSLSIPKFDINNGDSAKKRAQSQKRMSRKRYARSVTKEVPDKIREEVQVNDTSVSSPTPLPSKAQDLWEKMSDRPFPYPWYQRLVNRFGGDVVVMHMEKALDRATHEKQLTGQLEAYIAGMCQNKQQDNAVRSKTNSNGYKPKTDAEIIAEAQPKTPFLKKWRKTHP
jgi:hypothetical protein